MMNFDIINNYNDFMELLHKNWNNKEFINIMNKGELVESYALDISCNDSIDIYNNLKEFYCYNDYEMEDLTIEFK